MRVVKRGVEFGPGLGPSCLALKTNALALKSPIESAVQSGVSRAILLNSKLLVHYSTTTHLLANLLARRN
jgi:hypothetical protein